ncbi:MlaC/ttg2D family ABC transporter substrate-binding protein [Turneriella parva]|uniref:Toluene tolerance family protein n=1 Tax=Turneriella parva (strain ATCC BAA-1111 / DSM 21527 / NCTC 11395 / H) TaxID=869212 RepID=I4B416_TURPD|nr:ABC transporter substrate-binding protein [Turneriella parva]AFM12023.1 toluene tolerance family protein [Turneriella parva DSM 21527]
MMRSLRLLFCFAFVATAVHAGEGLEYMQNIINSFEQLRGELAEDFSAEKRKDVSARARDLALQILDIKEIGKLALGSYFNKLNPKQQEDFLGLFHELMANRVVEANIPSQKVITGKIPIEIISERVETDDTFGKEALIVNTKVPHRKQSFKVEFYLYRSDDGLKLYDVHIDEASTLLDFRNQFSSIIKKKGYKHLVKLLRERIQRINK